MSEQSGLDALTQRVQRGRRRVPEPRHPRPGTPVTEPSPEQDPQTADHTPPEAAQVPPTTEHQPGPPRKPPAQPELGPRDLVGSLAGAPSVMLGARIRTPLDDYLAETVHSLRKDRQVRTSKVELVELAVLQLALLDDVQLAELVHELRAQTSRYTGRR